VEFLTGSAFISMLLLRNSTHKNLTKFAFVIPFLIVAITDAVIGNTFLLFWTWGAWIAVGLTSLLFSKVTSLKTQLPSGIGFGISGTLLFFLITNFAVWTLGWYPMTFAGLMQSYAMGIPFLWPQLIGNIIIVPALTAITYFIMYPVGRLSSTVGAAVETTN
jgi:hypothetical protein